MTDVFDQNTSTPPNVSNDPFADKLKTIVNDNGQPKYENVDKALDALSASQAHIKRLEDEAKAREQETIRLREEAAKASTLEDIVARLSSQNKAPVETPTNPVDVEKVISAQVQAALNAQEASRVANLNGAAVRNALVGKFGDVEKAREAVNVKAAELGMSPTQLAALSSQSPKMVLSLFGLTEPNISASPTTPSPTSLNPPRGKEPVKAPEKSLLSGPAATDANRRALMKQIKDEVYAKFNVETV